MWLTQSIDCYAVIYYIIYIFPLKTDLKKVEIYKPALSQTEGTTQSITTSSRYIYIIYIYIIYIFPLKTDLKKVQIYKPALSQTEGTTQSITTSSLKENVRAIWLLPRNKGTSSSGGGHAKFLMIIVTDGHASHDCAKFAELYTFKGVFIFGWFTRISRNCFNFKGPLLISQSPL